MKQEVEKFDFVINDFDARRYDADVMKIFTTPDTLIQNIYDPQTLNHYAFERNNPYGNTDESGKAAIWIHYSDTYNSYINAGFSEADASTVAAGSIEPDLYRMANSDNRLTSILSIALAIYLDLDLEMEYSGEEAEKYYHEGEDLDGNSVDLEKAYWEAIEDGDLEKAGNIEHALGHDVGSNDVSGYHDYEIQNNIHSDDHLINDVFSTRTDREALNSEQTNRASSARRYLEVGESSTSNGITITRLK